MHGSVIQRAKNGDKAAFRELYHQSVGKAYGLCLRLLGDAHAAEDACQDVYIKAWHHLKDFREDADFKTWLHRIATTTAIDHWRKLKSVNLAVNLETSEETGAQLQDADQARDLEQAISRLPNQARAVFILFALEGYGHGEIAQLLDIAEGSSKAQYHRARQLLRDQLSRE